MWLIELYIYRGYRYRVNVPVRRGNTYMSVELKLLCIDNKQSLPSSWVGFLRSTVSHVYQDWSTTPWASSQFDATVGSIGVNMGQHPCGTLSTPCSPRLEELRLFWGLKGEVLLNIRKVFLMFCTLSVYLLNTHPSVGFTMSCIVSSRVISGHRRSRQEAYLKHIPTCHNLEQQLHHHTIKNNTGLKALSSVYLMICLHWKWIQVINLNPPQLPPP